MANELGININLTYANGDAKVTFQPGQINANQTTQGYQGGIVVVDSSAWESIPVGDITNKGFMVGRNLDSSNFVQIKPTTASTAIQQRISAGKPFCFEWEPGATLKWRANTADVKVQIHLFEV